MTGATRRRRRRRRRKRTRRGECFCFVFCVFRLWERGWSRGNLRTFFGCSASPCFERPISRNQTLRAISRTDKRRFVVHRIDGSIYLHFWRTQCACRGPRFFPKKLRVSAVKRGAADGRPARRRASLARAVGSPRPTQATQSEARESPLGAPPTPLSASPSDGSAREGRRRQIGSADLSWRRRRRRRG